MNASTIDRHPAEDALIDYALHESDAEILSHIEECAQCGDFVTEIRMVTSDIADIDDEPVPQRVCDAILAISRGRRSENYLLTFLQNWYRNPFLIGLATIGLILLLYAVIWFHL